MQMMMTISDTINVREPMVFMVEEAQINQLMDAAMLLLILLTGISYIDCVEYMV